MNKKNWVSVVAILATTNFIALSHFSQYRIDQLKSFNWDIALMLSPYGLINNFFLSTDHYLRPYYFESVQRPPDYPMATILIFITIQIVLSGFCLYRFKVKGR